MSHGSSSPELPVDPFLPRILDAVRSRRAVVVTAAPGAGKTTRVAPALAADGPALLLQPRRVAARAIARRIADERGWTVGDQVGWQVRFERRYGPSTRLLVATEGILTARAQADPLLSDFLTIVIDEFHERSLHADLAIALARQAWEARDDLRLVVMSATLEAGEVAEYLGGCPIVRVPGRLHPIDVTYLPSASLTEGVQHALDASRGQVLAFLPGAPEIRRAATDLSSRMAASGIEIVPLHGSLPADEQDRAIAPSPRRRIILATNVAETSLTVPGVTAVVDTGLHKVLRFDAARGIDSLETERIAADSAEQRAGRAARLGPGVVVRLWDERDRLRRWREPEIQRVDLSALVMDVLAWGGTPERLTWFEAPPVEGLAAAWRLLEQLGAVKGPALTPLGDLVRRLPLSPRLARILVEAEGAPVAAAACALLSERMRGGSGGAATTSSDVLSALDDRSRHGDLERVSREIQRVSARVLDRTVDSLSEAEFLRAILAGYPDRVARRRAPGSPRVVLASGHGGVLTSESGVRDGEFLVAVDVVSGEGEARIRMASRIAREWLTPTSHRIDHRFDTATTSVRAVEQDLYDRLVVSERSVAPDPAEAARLLAAAWLDRGPSDSERRLLSRLRFAGLPVDLASLATRAAEGCRSLAEVRLERAVDARAKADLDRLAPPALTVPSGRSVTLEYTDEGTVRASVKLQELFGLADSPRIGPRRVAVQFALLSPGGRPVQLTQDLRSFWDRVYPEVRQELRGRYPKHPWPEDPWTAPPTARTVRQPKR